MSDLAPEFAALSPVEYFTRTQASANWIRVLGSFSRWAGAQPGQRALDLGCGPGALVRHLTGLGCQAAGLDAEFGMVAQARVLFAEGPVVAGTVLALPFAANSVDLVTATNLLFLLPDPPAAVQEMARVCRRSGTVALLNPAPALTRASAQAHAEQAGLTGFEAYSFQRWGELAETHPRLDPETLTRWLGAAGLQSIAITAKIGIGLALLVKGQKA